MLALVGALALGAVGADALAADGEGEGRPVALEPNPLERPGRHLDRSIARFKRAKAERVRRRREARYVLGVPRATLEAIASCESGGNPRAISSGGTYRGKYQFSYSTWASVGGKGDPARAGELEQDRRAAILYERSGSSPWPVCG